MTAHRIDPATGRLRIKRSELAVLPARDIADERLSPALAALQAPRLALQLRVVGPGGSAMHSVVLGDESAAVALGVDAVTVDLFSTIPAAVPHLLARVLSVGPRPRLAHDPLAVGDDIVESVLATPADGSVAALRTAGSAWSDWAAGFDQTGPWRIWSIVAEWQVPDATPEIAHSLVLLDNPRGMAWSGDDHLHATTPTEVLIMLIRLLGGPDEQS